MAVVELSAVVKCSEVSEERIASLFMSIELVFIYTELS
jgi:hypothetical protein